jgi:tetratricopeptide (TPR) repeat protein
MIDRKKSEAIIFLLKSDPKAALTEASKLIEKQPDEAWTWSTRALVHERIGDIKAALADIDQALVVDFDQPSNHFKKAWILISIQQYDDAIISLTTALDIGNRFEFYYYNSTCLFFRSVCYCRIGDFDRAQVDIESVDEDMTIWVDKLRTTAEIVEACKLRHLS